MKKGNTMFKRTLPLILLIAALLIAAAYLTSPVKAQEVCTSPMATLLTNVQEQIKSDEHPEQYHLTYLKGTQGQQMIDLIVAARGEDFPKAYNELIAVYRGVSEDDVQPGELVAIIYGKDGCAENEGQGPAQMFFAFKRTVEGRPI